MKVECEELLICYKNFLKCYHKLFFYRLTGVYRIPGADPVVKELLEKFLRGKGLPKLGQYDDVHVVASCLKHFLRKLKVGWF